MNDTIETIYYREPIDCHDRKVCFYKVSCAMGIDAKLRERYCTNRTFDHFLETDWNGKLLLKFTINDSFSIYASTLSLNINSIIMFIGDILLKILYEYDNRIMSCNLSEIYKKYRTTGNCWKLLNKWNW